MTNPTTFSSPNTFDQPSSSINSSYSQPIPTYLQIASDDDDVAGNDDNVTDTTDDSNDKEEAAAATYKLSIYPPPTFEEAVGLAPFPSFPPPTSYYSFSSSSSLSSTQKNQALHHSRYQQQQMEHRLQSTSTLPTFSRHGSVANCGSINTNDAGTRTLTINSGLPPVCPVYSVPSLPSSPPLTPVSTAASSSFPLTTPRSHLCRNNSHSHIAKMNHNASAFTRRPHIPVQAPQPEQSFFSGTPRPIAVQQCEPDSNQFDIVENRVKQGNDAYNTNISNINNINKTHCALTPQQIHDICKYYEYLQQKEDEIRRQETIEQACRENRLRNGTRVQTQKSCTVNTVKTIDANGGYITESCPPGPSHLFNPVSSVSGVSELNFGEPLSNNGFPRFGNTVSYQRLSDPLLQPDIKNSNNNININNNNTYTELSVAQTQSLPPTHPLTSKSSELSELSTPKLDSVSNGVIPVGRSFQPNSTTCLADSSSSSLPTNLTPPPLCTKVCNSQTRHQYCQGSNCRNQHHHNHNLNLKYLGRQIFCPKFHFLLSLSRILSVLPALCGAFSSLVEAYEMYCGQRVCSISSIASFSFFLDSDPLNLPNRSNSPGSLFSSKPPSTCHSTSALTLPILQLLLISLWCTVCGYLAYSVLEGLMDRWLVTYATPAVIVRLLSSAVLNILLSRSVVQAMGPGMSAGVSKEILLEELVGASAGVASTRAAFSGMASSSSSSSSGRLVGGLNQRLRAWILLSCILTIAYAVQNYFASNLVLEKSQNRQNKQQAATTTKLLNKQDTLKTQVDQVDQVNQEKETRENGGMGVRKENEEKQKKAGRGGRRSVDLYNLAVFAVVPIGMASFLTMLGMMKSILLLQCQYELLE